MRKKLSRAVFRVELMERRVLLATISGTVFDDLDADGVIDIGESGMSGWTVFLDDNANGTWDIAGTATLASTDVPKSIPDLSTITSVLNVAGQSYPIADVNVSLNISHTWNADLDVYLISPAGTRVELFTDVGGSGDGMNITLDDEASTSIASATSSPITGTWRPEGLLAAFDGQSANGQWRLEITDDAATDIGTLNSWSITFTFGEVGATSGSTGAYTLGNLGAGTYRVAQVLQVGWQRTLPAAGYYIIDLPTSGSTSAGNNFGDRLPPGQISGYVFGDYDSDGVKDPNEPGLSGWTVYLDNNDNGVIDSGEPTAICGGDGYYLLQNVKPGQRTVRVMLQSGWVQTVPGSGGVVLGPEAGAASVAAVQREFAKTEIVAAVSGNDGLAVIRQRRRDARIAGLFDLARSRNMFTVGGATLVQVALPAGVDPLAAVSGFSRLPGVQWAQPNYIYNKDPRELTPNDPSYGLQYHHPKMQNNLAWDTTLGSASIIIAITDDGVSLAHVDLSANIWVNTGEIPGNGIDDDGNGYIDDRNGWDFSSNDNDPNPLSGDTHGTHVAGIAAARTNNGIGVAGTAGRCTIMPIRFYGSGAWTSTVVANSFAYAANNGARIVSTSYSIDHFVGDSIFLSGLQYLYDRGVLHLNSAGNNGQLNPPRQAFDQSLLVVNTNSSDEKNSTSNYGWGVDICAPGTSIYSTIPGNTYGYMSGTSMAAPNAAGAAALIWSANPTWTRDQVAAQLIGTADSIDAVNPAYAGLLGSGRVNSYRGVTQTVAPPRIKSLAGLPAEGATIATKPASFTLDLANVFNAATVIGGSFELRGDGLDDTFGTADDTFVSLTLQTTYRIGTNRLVFSISGPMGSDCFRFSALPSLTDPFGQPLDGNGDSVGGDAYTRTFTLIGLTNPYRVNVASYQTVTDVNYGNRENVPPRALVSSFQFETGQALQIVFSEDVSASLGVADLVLRNDTTSQTILPADISLAYDVGANTATITFSGYAGGILPDGNYTARLLAAGVTDLYNNVLDGDGDGAAGGDYLAQFFVLGGDANRDRTVDITDLGVFATNWQQSPRTFSQADFNYDSVVDIADLGILATNWQVSLPLPGPDMAAVASALPQMRRPTRHERVARDVLEIA